MFDFTVNSITRVGIIYCSVFYFFMVLKYWNSFFTLKNHEFITKRNGNVFILLFFAFVLTSWTNGDWHHYMYFVRSYTGAGSTGFESFYEWVIQITHKNYLLFRVVVWGLATIFLCKTTKNFGVNLYMALLFLFIIYIDYFDYSRAALGISCYMCGFSLLVLDKKLNLRKILALTLIVGSFFFHRSMLVLIVLTVFIVVPINKRTIILFFVTLFFAFAAFKGLFVDVLNDVMTFEDEGMASRAILYGTVERESLVGNASFLGTITSTWKWIIILVNFIIVSLAYFKNKSICSRPVTMLYRLSFFILTLAGMIYFTNFGHLALFYRVYGMSYIALTILSCYFYQNQIMTRRTFYNLLYFGGGYMAFTWLYRCYIGG